MNKFLEDMMTNYLENVSENEVVSHSNLKWHTAIFTFGRDFLSLGKVAPCYIPYRIESVCFKDTSLV